MVDLISAGDTAWILGATILVLLMSVPGIAFFYGGLTKKKNVLNSMFLALIAFAIASVIWVVYGYSFAFGDTSLHGLIAAWRHQSAWTDCCACKFPHDGNRY